MTRWKQGQCPLHRSITAPLHHFIPSDVIPIRFHYDRACLASVLDAVQQTIQSIPSIDAVLTPSHRPTHGWRWPYFHSQYRIGVMASAAMVASGRCRTWQCTQWYTKCGPNYPLSDQSWVIFSQQWTMVVLIRQIIALLLCVRSLSGDFVEPLQVVGENPKTFNIGAVLNPGHDFDHFAQVLN